MFSQEDIGKSKVLQYYPNYVSLAACSGLCVCVTLHLSSQISCQVECAARALQTHNLRSEIVRNRNLCSLSQFLPSFVSPDPFRFASVVLIMYAQVTLYLDATKEWNRVVEAAKEATVIFNMIEYAFFFFSFTFFWSYLYRLLQLLAVFFIFI